MEIIVILEGYNLYFKVLAGFTVMIMATYSNSFYLNFNITSSGYDLKSVALNRYKNFIAMYSSIYKVELREWYLKGIE